LNELVEEHLDLKPFEQRYANDETGRPAYDPKVLLKVVLYGYYNGLISSRSLAEACRRDVVFMALSADSQPHFTTMAGFVGELDREIVGLFRDVLLAHFKGRETIAVSGVVTYALDYFGGLIKPWSPADQTFDALRSRLPIWRRS
jgi:transposase